jgi:hypothetical protein
MQQNHLIFVELSGSGRLTVKLFWEFKMFCRVWKSQWTNFKELLLAEKVKVKNLKQLLGENIADKFMDQKHPLRVNEPL